jgi:O-antigen ligase
LLFVFSLPWDLVSIELVGSVTRLAGVAAVAVGALTLVLSGRFRRPNLILMLALVFTLLNAVSLFWTIDRAASIERVITYAQLLGLTWLIWEFARTLEQQEMLMIAYCLGAYLCIFGILQSYATGFRRVATWGERYSGLGFDPNDLGLILALGIPMAWHLFLNRRGIIRFIAGSYVPAALMGILLTASRGAFLSSLVGLSIVPLAWPRRSFRSTAVIVGALVAGAVLLALVVPQSSWDRILTITTEVQGGKMSGRIGIWEAAWQVFQERMVFGAGAGAFAASVEPLLGPNKGAHNAYLAILVEQGVVGIVSFVALLVACSWSVFRLRGPERKLWTVLALTWFVGVMALNWQYRKITWLLFGLLSAQSAVRLIRDQAAVPAAEGRRGRERLALKRMGNRPPTAA